MTQITGAQLAQMVNGAVPSSDRGLIIVSTAAAPTTLFPYGVPNVPDARNTGTPEWQRYIWICQYNTFATAYVWNPTGATDATYLNWVSINQVSYGPNTIPGSALITGSVPSTAIDTVASQQITGGIAQANNGGWMASGGNDNNGYTTPGVMLSNYQIYGVLQGTLACPSFATTDPAGNPGVIPSGAFKKQTIAGNATLLASPIVDGTIASAQLLAIAGGTATPALSQQITGAVDPAVNITLPKLSQKGIPNIAPSTQAIQAGDVLGVAYGVNQVGGLTTINYSILSIGNPTPASTQLQIPYAAQGSGVYTLGSTSALQGALYDNGGVLSANAHPVGRILQYQSSALVTTTQPCASAGSRSIADNAASLNTTQTSGVAVPITPIAGTSGSKIIVNATIAVYESSHPLWLGIYDSVAAVFVAWARFSPYASGVATGIISMKFITTALTVNTVRTYTVYIGTTSGTATDGAINQFAEGSIITAEEYI